MKAQYAQSDLTVTLFIPILYDFCLNLVFFLYIHHYMKEDKNQQTLVLIQFALKKVFELSSSLGGMFIISCIWLSHREDFFMIDTVDELQLRKAIVGTLLDFVLKTIALHLYCRFTYKVWLVDLKDLVRSRKCTIQSKGHSIVSFSLLNRTVCTMVLTFPPPPWCASSSLRLLSTQPGTSLRPIHRLHRVLQPLSRRGPFSFVLHAISLG